MFNSIAVKPARHGRPQANDFRRIVAVGQSVGQFTQFLRGELTTASQADGELNDLQLLRRREMLNLFDDFSRGHEGKIPGRAWWWQAPHIGLIGRRRKPKAATWIFRFRSGDVMEGMNKVGTRQQKV